MMTDAEILGKPPPPGCQIYRDGDAVAAVLPVSETMWEAHCGASPDMRGKAAIMAFKRMVQRFWVDHPTVDELLGFMRPSHRSARINAVRVGFEFDIISNVVLRGEALDVAFYRMKRP